MNKIHSAIHRLHNADLGVLFLRVAVGVVFIHAGYLKLADMTLVITGFGAIGFPAWLAYFVAYCELLGGLAVLLGIFVRYAGVVLAIIMLVAFWKVLGPNGFGLSNNPQLGGGYEYVFVLFFSSLALVTLGAGKYSLARLLSKF